MEGPRHSIDVPLSRTLVALRRVRSLRDPSTNPTSKLTAFVDTLNWEPNSNNAIISGFENGPHRAEIDAIGRRNLTLAGEDEQRVNGHEPYYSPRAVETVSDDRINGGGLSNAPDEMLRQAGKRRVGGKIRHRKVGVLSRVGSPCSSADDQLSNGIPFDRLRSCWTGSRRVKESILVEEQPLLLEDVVVSRFEEKSESLCEKYTPKSFDELLGQNAVSISLSNAISTKQIASFYLFHGPRGTGKTSASRIFSAALNCLSPEASRPCGSCQECVLSFSRSSQDVREVDSMRINKQERCRSLIKNTRIPPVFSRFKVYIIDECHLLQRETWMSILNSLDEISRHTVFVMATPELDKLPRRAISKSRRFRFQKVEGDDIGRKLGRICVTEGFDFDQDALDFIATKSNGSLREAEMMLDQLSLVGKKITVSLIYEVNGVVSDNELLDLLYLALSSDASNTVKMARKLIQSRIDPLQLVSQLASLIVDVLAGKCPDGASEERRNRFANNSEADTRQLSHALRILSQAEKQLRTSSNQTTWLTVALLQLSSTGSSRDARFSTRSSHSQDADFLSTSSTSDQSLKRPVACGCANAESAKTGTQFGNESLVLVWIRATQMCTSTSLKKFLLKRGTLVSVRLIQGIAVAEVEFDHPDHVSKAEKSWKSIAGILQHTLGHNVELRISLGSHKNEQLKKPCFSFFSCSRRVHLHSAECQSNASENSDSTPTTVVACSSECGSRLSCTCCHGRELFKSIRGSDGNALSVEVSGPGRGPDSVLFKPESKTGSKEYSRFHCWRSAIFPFRKAWQLRHHQRSECLADYALYCAVAQ